MNEWHRDKILLNWQTPASESLSYTCTETRENNLSKELQIFFVYSLFVWDKTNPILVYVKGLQSV